MVEVQQILAPYTANLLSFSEGLRIGVLENDLVGLLGNLLGGSYFIQKCHRLVDALAQGMS
jgi:hypothetical protein